MSQRTVDKRVLNLLLEAVRGAMGHLRDMSKELMRQGLQSPPGLAKSYRGAQKLGDYLQRITRAYSSAQDIELDDEDCNLLASCVAHRLSGIEAHITQAESGSKEHHWLTERRDVLIWLAHRLMTKGLEPLPDPHPLEREFASVVGLMRYRPKPDADHKNLVPPPREQMIADSQQQVGFVSLSGGPASRATPQEHMNVFRGLGELDQRIVEPAQEEKRRVEAGSGEVEGAFDPERIRDYKLRSFAKMDLHDLARAEAEGNTRHALLHLGALIECVVLDSYLPRRQESNLSAPPSHWNFVQLATELLGEMKRPEDTSILARLFDMAHWIRPSRQLLEPVVLTMRMVQEAKELLHRVLHSANLDRGVPGQASADSASDGSSQDGEGESTSPKASGLWRATRSDT